MQWSVSVWLCWLCKLVQRDLSPTFSQAKLCIIVSTSKHLRACCVVLEIPCPSQALTEIIYFVVSHSWALTSGLFCRLLSGVKKHFIFQHHDGKVSVRNNVVVTHLTSVSLKTRRWLCHISASVSTVRTNLYLFCAAELPALRAGAYRSVRPSCVQAAEVHRRGDGLQLGALPSDLWFLLQLQEGLGASLQDLPGLCVGTQQVLHQLQKGAHHNRKRAHMQWQVQYV